MLWLLATHSLLHGATAQSSSRNITLYGSLPVEGGLHTVHVDQNPDRPWVYALDTGGRLNVIDVSDTASPVLAYRGDADNAGTLTSFKKGGDCFLVLGGEHLVVITVTDPTAPVVFDSTAAGQTIADLFAYKHSSGATLVLVAGTEHVSVYAQDVTSGPLLTLDTPSHPGPGVGFENVFAGFEPETQQDRLYLAAAGGYYIYDITHLDNPVLLTSIHSAAVQRGRVIAPVSDGKHALTLASYRTAPMRIFSLSQPRVRTAVGAWTDNWQSELVDVMVRWPLAFVAALEHGLQVVNIYDTSAPYTDAWFLSVDPEADETPPLTRMPRGVVSIDVRNHDGLILAADMDYGLWLLGHEALMGWHGHAWGLPNMSDVQDWDHGPDGK